MTGPEKLRQLADDIAGLMEQERTLAGLSAPPADVHERVRQLNAATISPELGKWFVDAVEKFLSGGDLEKAFGLVPSRGRPRQGREAKNYKRARRVFDLLRGAGDKPPLTMDEILAKHFINANKVDLENEQDRYQDLLRADLAREVADKIRADLAKKTADKINARSLTKRSQD
jgi:hypothetical protein